MTNKNIKLGFVKSKAFGLCGVILTAALLAIMAPNAYADEVTSEKPATETVAPTQPVTESVTSTQPTTEAVAPAAETPVTEATANATEETPTVEKAPTEVSKEGTTITVKNPDVDMHFTKG